LLECTTCPVFVRASGEGRECETDDEDDLHHFSSPSGTDGIFPIVLAIEVTTTESGHTEAFTKSTNVRDGKVTHFDHMKIAKPVKYEPINAPVTILSSLDDDELVLCLLAHHDTRRPSDR